MYMLSIMLVSHFINFCCNILLVITGARDAMLLQSFEDQSKEQNGWEEICQVSNKI